MTSTTNFGGASDEVLRIDENGLVGIGTTNPYTRLHIIGEELASNSTDGYMLLGSKTGLNLIMDQNDIAARDNGSPSNLFIQTGGGNTWFGDGHVHMGMFGDGKVSLGSSPLNAKFNINDSDFQLKLSNSENGINDWYIGASNFSWQTGDDYLLFSPTTGHLNSLLRLYDTDDNDGILAPVMITTSASQWLLMDGNEIDSKSNALYINHNSDHNTYINPTGGKVGIGTTSPQGMLHIKTTESGIGLSRDLITWTISPNVNGDLQFFKNLDYLAYVDYSAGGDWIAVSDKRLKDNITPLTPVMGKIKNLNLVTYSFNHDPSGSIDMGIIAQQLESYFPEAVSIVDGQYGVYYDQLTVVALKGIQEQQELIDDLMKQADELLRIKN
jgi:prepilin-type processing-associated H-X9-DG protein